MNYKKSSEILKQAINYDEKGRTRHGNWMLGTDGIEAIEVAIEALEAQSLINTATAMHVITKELKADKSEGSWYYSWQSNIACTIMDNSDIEHDKANEIAIKFLDRLIS